MCEACGDEEYALPAMALTWCDPLIIGFRLCEGLVRSVASAFGACADALTMHANLLAERDTFRREAGYEIERLTEEP